MWFIINSNKRKTWIILFSMVLLLVVFISTISSLIYGDDYSKFEFTGGIFGIILGILCSIGIIFYTKSEGSKFFLNQVKAVEIDKLSNTVLKNIVEEMAIASSLGFVPKIYIIDSKIPNAFAVGVNAKNAAIAVTTGLLSVLNRDELTAVVAHETSHIKNQDTLYLLYAGVIFGIIVTVSDVIIRSISRSSRRNSKGGGAAILLLFLLAILSPIFARLLYLSLSRKREFLADACACQYTRYPVALASALSKISSFTYSKDKKDDIKKDELIKSGKIVSCMYIHNNLQNKAKNFIDRLFQTHPPIEKRIEVLSKMSSADLNAYVNSYSTVVQNKKTLISKRDLESMNIAPLAIVGASIKEEQKEDRITRQREAKDEYKKAAKYKIIKCDCKTILKIPPEFMKKTVTCPHCKKVFEI